MHLRTLLLGRKLATKQASRERVGALAGLPILGLDAVASAAYGPEALLTVLLAMGALADRPMLPLTLVVIALLVIVAASYSQTIDAYPDGGGSFTVSRQNLGERWGALAGAALGLDYVLNVAVAISSGVGALVSALPDLQPLTLPLCLAILAFLTLVNLRGVRSTGAAFMAPTYLFVACVGGTLLLGLLKSLAAHGHPVPVVAPPHLPATLALATPWLLMRAFASGCTAMTGIEAVSNGVPIFRDPKQKRAKRTLFGIVGILVLLLAGIALVCRAYGVAATTPGHSGYESVLSQITGAVIGRGAPYYVTMASIITVLALSANTSFADFPRVCRLLAIDHFLPRSFAHQGRRLAFTVGVLVLASLAALLLVAFDGVTDRLIPLFAIGAFLAFTLSQSGMVVHWKRRWRETRGAKAKLFANALGALATGATVVVVLAAKFAEGAWLSVALVGAAVAGLTLYRRRALRVLRETDAGGKPLEFRSTGPCHVIVPVSRWDLPARKALRFALHFGTEVVALQILTGDPGEQDLTDSWARLVEEPAARAGFPAPRLVVVHSEYRELYGPLVRLVRRAGEAHPDGLVMVVVPDLVERGWYGALVDHPTSAIMKELLVLEGGPKVVVVSAPFYVGKRPPERRSTGPRRLASGRRRRASSS